MPSTYYGMSTGEKLIVNAFVSFEIEKRIEEAERLKGS